LPPLSRLLPRTFRARLVLAFGLVVAIALALVLAALPRLLDGYFAQQEQRNLESRANAMRPLLILQLQSQLGHGTAQARPIVLLTDPPRINPQAAAALGQPDDPNGFVRRLANVIALSNVELIVSLAPERPQEVVYRLQVPVSDSVASVGQKRDDITFASSFTLRDEFWSQFPGGTPERLFALRLSQPFTYRAQTLETVVGVLFAAAGLALVVAVITSLLLADRLGTPVRRLTQASRALAEGDLTARVSAPPSGSPEISELATAFNRMAERLQASIEFIRRDRDRSRDFLADVSHELRTPIAALRTFNELLQDGAVADPATRQEFLESSRQQIERLDWLATNLLELSKLDTGLVALDLRPDDLRAAVESAVQQAEPAARRKGVTLVAELPEEPLRQRHDPQRMGQVLGNLIGNALKFTAEGGRIEVRLRPTPSGAELQVADSGIGIDPAELPHVFDRFFRGSQMSELRAVGSGLGLSIVRSIVEMHGGRVAIQSTPGTGTTVSVVLPRDGVEALPDVAESSPLAARP
jgi:signal transduction histidine kinase